MDRGFPTKDLMFCFFSGIDRLSCTFWLLFWSSLTRDEIGSVLQIQIQHREAAGDNASSWRFFRHAIITFRKYLANLHTFRLVAILASCGYFFCFGEEENIWVAAAKANNKVSFTTYATHKCLLIKHLTMNLEIFRKLRKLGSRAVFVTDWKPHCIVGLWC